MSSSEDIAIKVEHVSKTFKLPHEKAGSIKNIFVNFYKRKRTFETQRALKNVSFQIKTGEFFAIVGRNGSGKSTLLKLLAGIYTPTEGHIQVNGKLTPFIELGVGFNQELSGRENVYLNGALLGFSRKEMDTMYNDIVEFAELERFMDQKLKNYSSGMQVRLAFSIAIRAQSDILLLDEVLAVGDAAFQQKCYNYFEELKQQHKTVVFVSHDMSAVRRFCTRAVYIDNGKLTHMGTPAEIADVYTLQNIKSAPQETGQDQGPSPYHIVAKVVTQTDRKVLLDIKFKSPGSDDMYMGIAVLRDGVSVAEITTSLERPLTGNGKVRYELDVANFNGGEYEVGAGLFRLKNRELLAAVHQKSRFVIKGDDITRGAALKLADSWEY